MRSLVLLAALAALGCGPSRSDFEPQYPIDEGTFGIVCDYQHEHDIGAGCVDTSPNLYLVHVDDSGESFVLQSSAFRIDDGTTSRFKPPPAGSMATYIPIARWRLQQTSHVLHARARYRGHGNGIFSYLKGYRFEVKSTHEFEMGAKVLRLDAITYLKGGVTTPLEKRLGMKFLSTEHDVPLVMEEPEPASWQ